MTREFDKQRRNDTRPSFRNNSANRYGDERSPRPARPRLNRETVDRAWESGAQHAHADYRPRSSNGQPLRNNYGQPPRNNWRNQQSSEYSSSQHGHGGNRPSNNQRQEQYRDNPRRYERAPGENNGPRSRSFDSNNTGRREYSGQRPGERRDYRERSTGTGGRPGYRDNGQFRDRGGQFQGRDQDRDHRRRDSERDERGGRSFGHSSFESDRRDGRGYQGQRSGPDTGNPRSQNRSWEQQQPNDRPGRPSHSSYNGRNDNNERFKGDYERFDRRDEAPNRRDDVRRPGRPEDPRERQRYDNKERAEEQHVTRLPDGRVLKGPRPVQRKEAQFWAGISENTDDLIGHIPTPASTDMGEPAAEADDKPAKARKPRTRIASATVRAKKAKTAGAGKRGPRPSQRGFKWPTQ